MMIGAHVSIAGGIERSIQRGTDLGCTALQTFASSPRMMRFVPLLPDQVALYAQLLNTSPIKAHVFHGIYLINLAHENPEYVEICVQSLQEYQRLAGQLNALGTVFHVGSHKGKGLEAVKLQVAQALSKVIGDMPKGVCLMLENTAGQNGSIGATVKELHGLKIAIEALGVDTSQLALGIDTQHAFAAGYDLASDMGLECLLGDIDMTWGLKALKVIHINDSVFPCGSHKDRHANWGEGMIGLDGLSRIVHHPDLQGIPFILEVPGENKSGPRAEDVQQVLQLL